MGPSGTVDFDDLVRQAGGMFVDPDFPTDDSSIYTDGQRSGFGAIKRVTNVIEPACSSSTSILLVPCHLHMLPASDTPCADVWLRCYGGIHTLSR